MSVNYSGFKSTLHGKVSTLVHSKCNVFKYLMVDILLVTFYILPFIKAYVSSGVS